MTPGARLSAVCELLELIDHLPTPADQILATYFQKRRYIGSHDRKQITHWVYGVFRARAHIDWFVLEQGVSLYSVSPQTAARLRVIAFLFLREKTPPHQIAVWFNGQPYHPSPLTSVEKSLFQGKILSFETFPLWVQGEIPPHLFSLFQASCPENTLALAQALNQEASLDLRVNTLKTSPSDMEALFLKQGPPAQKTPFSPCGLRLKSHHNISSLDVFQKGFIEIQDEGSQLIALLAGAQPGERVVDFCAGAGGKTLAMAAAMQNKGKILACDTASWRLKRAEERLRRAGVHNTSTYVLKDHQDPWLKRHREKIDKVLVDVPCSGAGTWRRHPEQKWRLDLNGLSRLVQLQGEILESASFLVRPGGWLIYSTCSLFQQENTDQITLFLKKSAEKGWGFSPLPVAQIWRAVLPSPYPGDAACPFLHLLPHLHQTDGFFLAILKKETPSA